MRRGLRRDQPPHPLLLSAVYMSPLSSLSVFTIGYQPKQTVIHIPGLGSALPVESSSEEKSSKRAHLKLRLCITSMQPPSTPKLKEEKRAIEER